MMDEPRVDRTAFSVFDSFEEADAADAAYWRSRTPEERLAHLELLRRINYGERAAGRMERVLVIESELPTDPPHSH
ncbi:MAG TPA: hypothetical protein VGB24_15435 [Longimicrobium sp.]|jgi:hypothetical protein|uniref:hypothetical protein n=1 Tax=Longimicrobium sp. TaxID=2029185 RepID=UPI002EDA60D1